jgi:hypothetical protein
MRANTCIDESTAKENSFEISSLPSAGEGSRQPSSRTPDYYAPQASYAPARRYHSGWHYEGEGGGGTTFTRPMLAPGSRQVLIVPTWPW